MLERATYAFIVDGERWEVCFFPVAGEGWRVLVWASDWSTDWDASKRFTPSISTAKEFLKQARKQRPAS